MPQYYACVCATDKTTGKVLRRTEKSGAFHDEYTYAYDEQGNLAFCRDLAEYHSPKETRYFYHDTLLKGVVLPDGTELVYVYDERGNNPLCPVAKYKNGKPVMEYFWKDIRHLESCVDIAWGIRFDFAYAKGKLSSIRLSRAGFGNGADILSRLGGGGTLLVFCDQVGTPRLFTNKAGRHIKELGYDSFGILEDDTLPELFVPIGFAGGLVDEDTGLVRFGFRDYDPNVGRFTCPDPLGDTGGDHDLYDYCVDDPVSMNDPTGLIPPLIGLALGIGGAGLIATGGTLAAAGIGETANAAMGKKEDTGKLWNAATGIVKEQIPQAVAVGMTPGIALAPGALGGAGRAVGAAIQGGKHGEAIINAAPKVKEFIEGFAIPGPPAMTSGAIKGFAVHEGVKKIKERSESK